MPEGKERKIMLTTCATRATFAAVAAALLTLNASAAMTNSHSLVQGESALAFDLYKHLKTTESNLFFSPYSISACLGMTYIGARGDTARQMAHVLHFNATPSELPTPMGALERQLNEVRQQ